MSGRVSRLGLIARTANTPPLPIQHRLYFLRCKYIPVHFEMSSTSFPASHPYICFLSMFFCEDTLQPLYKLCRAPATQIHTFQNFSPHFSAPRLIFQNLTLRCNFSQHRTSELVVVNCKTKTPAVLLLTFQP